MRYLFLLITCFTFLHAGLEDLPAPYCNLPELLPFDSQGGYVNHKYLEPLIKKKKVKVIIEVGSWLGASTRDFASMIPSDGKVYAVDHWQGSPIQSGNEQLFNIYDQFLSNVIHAGLTDKIVPIQMNSICASCYLQGMQADLIYIHASHNGQSILEDLEAWYRFIKNHGVFCGDNWGYPGVKVDVKKFAAKHKLKITHESDSFWRLKK